MLCILPFKIITGRGEEIFFIYAIPVGRITEDPGKGFVRFVDGDDRIFMACRKQNQIIFLIVPQRIIMEPVNLIGTVSCNRSGLSVFFANQISCV